jgi:hypothetical protein
MQLHDQRGLSRIQSRMDASVFLRPEFVAFKAVKTVEYFVVMGAI